METLANLGDGFAIAITWQNLLLALLRICHGYALSVLLLAGKLKKKEPAAAVRGG